MAYLVGYMTEQEEAEMAKRGWEIEPWNDRTRAEIEESKQLEKVRSGRLRFCWVNSSLFDIMNGPDWEKEEEDGIRE